jgi:hypothetical protein
MSACTIGSGLNSDPAKNGSSNSSGGGTGADPQSAPVEGSSATGEAAAATTVRFSIASGAVTYSSTASLAFPDAATKASTWDVCIAQNGDCSGCETQPLLESIAKTGLSAGSTAFSALYVHKTSQEQTACVTASTTVYPLEVQSLYSTAPNWNDYVKAADTTVACAGTENLYSDCIHGGDKRQVTTLETSCEGLALVDSSGAFDWSCEVIEGHARFTSAFAEDKGLADLVEAAGWKSLTITLTTPSTEGSSTAEAWWSNPVQPLPDNSESSATPTPLALSEASTIYTLATSRTTAGYNINADKVGVVILDGAELSEHGTAVNHNLTTCELDATANKQSILASGSQKFFWVEGSFRRNTAPDLYAGITVHAGVFYQIRNATLSDMTSSINLNQNGRARVENISLSSGSSMEISSNSTSGNLFKKIRAPLGQFSVMGSEHLLEDLETGSLNFSYANLNTIRNFKLEKGPSGRGIGLFNNSENNFFENGRVSNQSFGGIYINQGCSSNRFSRMTISNSDGYAFQIDGTSGNPIEDTLISEVLMTANKNGISATETRDLHVVASSIVLQGGSTGGTPFISDSDQNTVLHNLLIAGNKSDAIALWNSADPTLSQLYIDSGTDWSISLYGVSHDLRLTGNLVGPGPTCTAAATVVSPGWDTSAGSGCTPIAGSDLSKSTLSASFFGKLSTQDTENTDDNDSLTVSGAGLQDLSHFENRFRTWGVSGAFGDDATTGPCGDASTCTIWDFGLSSSDAAIRSRSDAPGTENTTLSAGSKCPAMTLANKTLTTAGGGTYLKLAIEEPSTDTGDNDGLCEANETCIYTPSIGVDQGHDQFDGATFETCSMSEVPILAGVTLKAYSAP